MAGLQTAAASSSLSMNTHPRALSKIIPMVIESCHSTIWPIQMQTAPETAHALAYLHASDIIHQNMKANNILLDNNFCVKVVGFHHFWLFRLVPNHNVHVSILAQGTPCSIDPEYPSVTGYVIRQRYLQLHCFPHQTHIIKVLQKFKLLATQCGVAQSPTRSPRTSPVVHLRRRKTTLRMLLSRSSSRHSPPRQHPFPPMIPLPLPHPQPKMSPKVPEKKRDTLKDLFVSSSPTFEDEEEGGGGGGGNNAGRAGGETISCGGKCEVYRMKVTGLTGEPGSPRPGWIGFRHRSILRRAWRPMLAGIPEND